MLQTIARHQGDSVVRRFSALVHLDDALPRILAARGVGHFMSGAAIGALVGLTALDLGFITGTGGAWVRPRGDWNSYLVAWHYFVGDGWRLPVFEVAGMSYPEGGNVVFSDALPL